MRTSSPRSLVTSVIDVLIRPVQALVYVVSGLIPRRMTQWSFGCWSGHRFGDNAGATFEHLAEHPRPGIQAAWITNERSIRDDLRRRGMSSHLAWSLRGLWWTMRSGVFVYDSLPKDINYWTCNGARLVLLRHGIGLKKIERALSARNHRLYRLFHGRWYERAFWTCVIPWHKPSPHLVMSSSPEHGAQANDFYGITQNEVRITGFPRHDRLADLPPMDRTRIPTTGEPVPAGRPVFVYLPTFREGLQRQSFDFALLARVAEAAGITIAVKLHYVDAERGIVGVDDLNIASHLRLIDPVVDPVDLYPHADGMISDYSSAPLDFILLDRPVVYFVPDAVEYIRSRPLMFTLEELAAGPMAATEDELRVALTEATTIGAVAYADRRAELKKRFHTFPPGGAAERVLDAIEADVRDGVSGEVSAHST